MPFLPLTPIPNTLPLAYAVYAVCHVGCYTRQAFNVAWALGLAYLSIPVLLNMWSSKQKMNHYFNPYRVLNTYGKFGRYFDFSVSVSFLFIRNIAQSLHKCRFMLMWIFRIELGFLDMRTGLVQHVVPTQKMNDLMTQMPHCGLFILNISRKSRRVKYSVVSPH